MLKRLDDYYYTVRIESLSELNSGIVRPQYKSFEGLENLSVNELTNVSIDKISIFGEDAGYIYGSSTGSVLKGSVYAEDSGEKHFAVISNNNETFLSQTNGLNDTLSFGVYGIPSSVNFQDTIDSYSDVWYLNINNYMPDIQEFKMQLRLDGNIEDRLIWEYIESAQYKVEDVTSISIGIKNFEEILTTSYNEEYVYLAMNPVVSIDQVILVDSEGAEFDITSDYSFRKDIGGYKIKVAKDESVVVTYKAGVTLDLAPKQMIQAMKLIVTDLFENRGDVVREKSTAVKHLLNQVAHKRF